jgi:hypothetical protein
MSSLVIQTQKPISSYIFSDRLRVAYCVADFVFLIRSYDSLFFFVLSHFCPVRFFFFWVLCFPFIITGNGFEVVYSGSDFKLIVLRPI